MEEWAAIGNVREQGLFFLPQQAREGAIASDAMGGLRKGDVKDPRGEEECELEHALYAEPASFASDAFPVDVIAGEDHLRDVAKFGQLGPSPQRISRNLDTQHDEKVLEVEGINRLPGDHDDFTPCPEAIEGERHREVTERQLSVEIDADARGVVEERRLPAVVGRTAVALRYEKGLGRRDGRPIHADVEIVILPGFEIPVDHGGQRRALEPQHREARRGGEV